MKRIFSFRQALTISNVSIAMTYVALTGVAVASLATSARGLPPAVETRPVSTIADVRAAASAAANAKSVAASSRAANVADTAPAVEEVKLAVATVPARDETSAQPVAAPDEVKFAEKGDLQNTKNKGTAKALPRARPISEVRPRLKTVKAKDVPIESVELAQPSQPDEETVAHAEGAVAKATDDGVADEKSDEEPRRARAGKAKSKADREAKQPDPPKPTAVVPVASDKPVDAPPAAPVTWSDADIMKALKDCLRMLGPVDAEVEPNMAMRRGECGTPAPILLKSIGRNPKIVFQPAAEVNCPMAVGLSEWASTTLQPAAREVFSSEVTRFVSSSGYSCRNRYGLPNERLSEHALANAIDIGGFGLANGKVIKLTTGWGRTARDVIAAEKAAKLKDAEKAKGSTKADVKDDIPSPKITSSKDRPTQAALKPEESKKDRTSDRKAKPDDKKVTEAAVSEVDGSQTSEGRFLRRLHKGACETFGTVLGPEANEAHRDHFHFDLKTRKRRSVCH